MPRASSRLDLVVTRQPPEASGELAAALDALGQARGWWATDHHAGPAADALVRGGFFAVRIQAYDREVLVANGLGGVSVRCPACGAGVAREFGRAVGVHREGGARRFSCPSCGAGHDLIHADVRPPAAFSRLCCEVLDAQDGEICADALDAIRDLLGAVRVIGRRVG